MMIWLFVILHVISLFFCLLATRTTFRYLTKHMIIPQHRYILFGRIRTRHMALFYVSSISLLTALSIGMALFYSFI